MTFSVFPYMGFYSGFRQKFMSFALNQKFGHRFHKRELPFNLGKWQDCSMGEALLGYFE